MSQAMLNIQVDEGLKNQFDLLCLEIGMTPASVINMFAKAVVKNKKVLIPRWVPYPSMNSRKNSSR